MIFDFIYCITVLLMLIFVLVFVYILENRVRKEKEDFINSLNEHDKSIILDYISKGRYFRKRDKKNVIEEREETINKD